MCSTTTSARWTTSGGKVMSDEATNEQECKEIYNQYIKKYPDKNIKWKHTNKPTGKKKRVYILLF